MKYIILIFAAAFLSCNKPDNNQTNQNNQTNSNNQTNQTTQTNPNIQIGRNPLNEIALKVNGKNWGGEKPITNIDDKNIFSISSCKVKIIAADTIPWEFFSIMYIRKTKDLQTIRNDPSFGGKPIPPSASPSFSHFSTMQDDGDVGCDSYHVLTSDSLNNWVQIDKEKGNYSEIWGRFNVSLLRFHGCSTSPYPDTLRITGGTFYIHL